MRLSLAVLCVLWLAADASTHPDTPRLLADVNAQLATRPGDPDLLMQRGVLYLDEEYPNLPQAIADLTAALARPGRWEALIFRATAYHRSGELGRARADLDRYVRQGPPDARAFELRAEVRLAQGDRVGAVADLAAAARVQPRPEQYLRRAEVQREAGQTKGAIATLEEGLTRFPAVDMAQRLIEIALAQRAFEAALKAAARLEAESGRKEPWKLRRAEILTTAGRTAEARSTYEEVLASVADRERAGGFVNQTALLERAQALLGLGRTAEAQAVFAGLGASARRLPDYDRLATALGAARR